jgi:hypothetical protein
MESAIERKKRLKEWKRKWKLKLIESSNPNWQDLYNTRYNWIPAFAGMMLNPSVSTVLLLWRLYFLTTFLP